MCDELFVNIKNNYNENSCFLHPTIVHRNYAYHEVSTVCLHCFFSLHAKMKAN